MENALTFVAVIPLLLYATGRGGYRYLLPISVAALVYLLIRTSVVGWGGGSPSLELMNNPFLRSGDGGVVALFFFERLPTVLYTALVYLKLLFVPVGLVHDYYPGAIELKGWADPLVLLSLVLHVALLGWSARHLRSRHALIAAGVWVYALTLSPVSNLLFSVGTFLSERFLFLPSLGFVLAVVAALSGWKPGKWVVAGAVVVCAVLTVIRNPVWQDNYTLFTTDLARQPHSAKLLNAAAGARLDRYQSLPEDRRAGEVSLLITAERDLDSALSIHPNYGNAFLLRGNARLLLSRYDEAIRDYHEATASGVPATTTDPNLIIALQRAGRAAGEERNDFTTALGYLRQAEPLEPNNYETLRLMGLAYGMSGNPQEALRYFERALAVLPGNEGAQRNVDIARQQLRSGRSGD